MIWQYSLPWLVFVLPYTLARHPQPAAGHAIEWSTCDPKNSHWPVTCGTLEVPLDYTNVTSGQTLNLSMIKVSATKQPVKGSILLNPGGPGEVSREFLGGFAEQMLVITGGQFDLIAFDTRGTGNTIPFSCAREPLEAAAWTNAAPLSSNTSDTGEGTAWSLYGLLAETCYEQHSDIGDMIGTAFVARDMMAIVDALNEDGKLRYYGYSYGTFLGATAAAMFPERIDKVVLDGVVNVHEFASGWDVEQLTAYDKSFHEFLRACADAPDLCKLARQGRTPEELSAKVHRLLVEAKYHPIILGSNLTTDWIQYDDLKSAIAFGLKGGLAQVPLLANLLDAAISKNLTAYQENSALLNGVGISLTYPNQGAQAAFGIRCADSQLREKDLESLQPLIDALYSTSSLSGDVQAIFSITCSQWKFESKGRYEGQFRVKTKNPILLLGSPYDPVTPVVSAHNTSAGYEGSVVLQQNGIGHCSIAQPSRCVIEATQAYFVNGTLPEHGKICEPEFPLFPGPNITEVLLEIYGEAPR